MDHHTLRKKKAGEREQETQQETVMMAGFRSYLEVETENPSIFLVRPEGHNEDDKMMSLQMFTTLENRSLHTIFSLKN
ncbi:hypothetical protein CapIbe_005561 [Capra ibex]